MEADNNRRSLMLVSNYEKVGGSIKRMFLSKDGRITRAATGDRNKVMKIREEVKPF